MMMLYLTSALMMVVIAGNGSVVVHRALQRRWWTVGGATVVILLSGGVVLENVTIAYREGKIATMREIANVNAEAECGPDAPKVVPFHQGMTLCPGQSAIVGVPVAPPLAPPSPAPDDRRL
jgi:hypothetical protein